MASFSGINHRKYFGLMLNLERIVFWLSLLFLTVWSFTGYGQTLKPRINTFSSQDYEGHSQIYSLAKGKNGVLYFGTSQKVLKYNGSEWKQIFVKGGFHILSLDIDSKGRIWIGGTGDLGYLAPKDEVTQSKERDQETQQKQTLSGKDQQPGELHFVSILDQVPDSLRDFKNIWRTHAMQDKVFFNTKGKFVFIYSKGGIKAIKAKNSFHKSQNFKAEAIKTNDSVDEFWVQSRGEGILRCQIKKGNVIDSSSFTTLPRTGFFNDKFVEFIIQWKENEVLIATQKNGLYRYLLTLSPNKDTSTKRIIPFAEFNKGKFQKAVPYGAIPLKSQNNPYNASVAINTTRGGSLLLNKSGEVVLHLNQTNGMPANSIWRSVKDNGGQMWYATDNGIAQALIGNQFTIAEEGKAFTGRISDISYYSDQKEDLLIATSQGVYHLESTEAGMPAKYNFVPGTDGRAIDLQSTGEAIFVGRASSGLLKIQTSGKEWQGKQIAKEHVYTVALVPESITKRLNAKSFIAYGGRGGIFQLQKNQDQWKRKLMTEELPADVTSLVFEPKLRNDSLILWAAFRTGGALRISLDTKVLNKPIIGDTNKVASNHFNRSYYDSASGLPRDEIQPLILKNRLVFGTDSGLYQIKNGNDPSDLYFVPDSSLGNLFIPKLAGGQGKQIFRLNEVNLGNVWMQSDHLYHLNLNERGYEIDSIPFRGFNLGTTRAFNSSKEQGIIWIGGDNGLVKYNSKVKKNFSRDYPCVISQVSIPKGKASGKDSALFHGKFYALDSSLHPPWKVVHSQPDWMIPTLHHDLNRLRFKFSAPYFEKQEAMEYSYKLAGFDNDWSRWKKETKKEYTNLPPGQYTFKVKAKNIYDHESQVGTYNVNVQAPFHRTIWFYGIQAGVLIIMGVLAGYLARTQKGRASKLAISLGTVVIFLVFEYCQNYVEVYFEDYLGGIVALKVALNVTVITLLIPFKTMMERLLLIQQDHLSEEGLKQKKVKEYKNMEWGSSNREEKL